jgi:response regulator of citrate/malate metabolism
MTVAAARGRTSIEMEIAALEAIEKAISSGHIDTRMQERESVAERLYMVLNQYEEENHELRSQVRIAQEEIEALRLQNEELKQTINSLFSHK